MSIKRRITHWHWVLSQQFGVDPLQMVRGVRGLPAYLRDWREFRKGYRGTMSLVPCLGDRYSEGGSTKNEYFWQDLRVAREIFQQRPGRHVDVGSRIDGFVAHVASFREIEVFDIRPISTIIPGVVFRQADLMSSESIMQYEEAGGGYCDSISCLHAIEHFGLGRYGDPVDPQGYRRGIANLARLLKLGGRCYLSTPIGKQRVEFNANWVFDPATIIEVAQSNGLMLDDLVALDQRGGQRQYGKPDQEALNSLANSHYHLGVFTFTKRSA